MEASERAVVTALRIAKLTKAKSLTFRLFGSCAVYLRCAGSSILADNNRKVKDVDGVVKRSDLLPFRRLMSAEGWQEQLELTALTDGNRLKFTASGDLTTILDVVVDCLRFNQELDLEDRLEMDWPTIPIADLVLSKFQIAAPSLNDLIDMATLLERFNTSPADESEVSLRRIESVCARSWRWYKATSAACEMLCSGLADRITVSVEQERTIAARAARIHEMIDKVPKSLGWKIRSLVGPRVSWITPVEPIDLALQAQR